MASIALLGFMLVLLPCIVSADSCSPLCGLGNWFSWDSCTRPCGGGLKLRKRTICCRKYQSLDFCLPMCGVKKTDLSEIANCNEDCQNGGTNGRSGCVCPAGFFGYCCQLENSNRTFSSSCSWGSWEEWSSCASSDGSLNGVHSHQREPICAKNETRASCMKRCGYRDNNSGQAWVEEKCRVPYTRNPNSAASLVQHWMIFTTAYALLNM